MAQAAQGGGSSGAQPGGSMAYVWLLASVAALGGLLFGYDTAVIAGAIGFLQWHFDLDPQLWRGWAAASALVGCACGAAMAGMASDRLGRKRVLLLSAVMFFVSAVGTAFPRTLTEFIIFRIIGGFGVGAASMTSPMYIAEVSPARIRGRMVSVNQFAIVSGILIVYFVNFFIAAYGAAVDRQTLASVAAEQDAPVDREATETFIRNSIKYASAVDPDDAASAADFEKRLREFLHSEGGRLDSRAVVEFLARYGVTATATDVELAGHGLSGWNVRRGWRWMFGSEALPAAVLLLLLFVVPESPRWLTKQGRRDEALAILTRIDGPRAAQASMTEIEEALAQETGSLGQLLMPGMRIVLVIGVVLAVLQQVTGINVFLYFGTEIFKGMGSGVDAALLPTILVGTFNLGFTVVAIWSVDRLGRKPLMLIGYTGMGISLAAMGLAAYLGQTDVWVLTFILGYIACFAISVGPITWVILAEIFPTKIRGRAMAIATVCLWIANFAVTQTFTWMDGNPTLTRLFNHALPFWLYAALCAVAVVFVARYVPETRRKTLEEIERTWLKG